MPPPTNEYSAPQPDPDVEAEPMPVLPGGSLDYSEVERLVSPECTADAFFKDVWEQKPLLVRHNDPKFFGDLLSIQDLEQVLDVSAHPETPFGETILFKHGQQQQYRTPFQGYMDGCSVVVNHLDKVRSEVYQFCRRLMGCLPHAYCNMYLTPAGSQAVHAHADDRDVFILQVWGRKHWSVYGAPVPFPYPDMQLGKQGLEVKEEDLKTKLIDEVLETGDVLYMPRGFLHQARTLDDSPSLHITVAIPTHDFTWAKFISNAIVAISRGDKMAHLRRAIPPAVTHCKDGSTEMAGIEDKLKELVGEVMGQLNAPECVEVFKDKIGAHCSKQTQCIRRLPPQGVTLNLNTVMIRNPTVDYKIQDIPDSPEHRGVVLCKPPDLKCMLRLPLRSVAACDLLMNRTEVMIRDIPAADDFDRLCIAITLARLGAVRITKA